MMFLRLERHNLSYRPVWPHFSLIRLDGTIKEKSIIGLWRGWVFTVGVGGIKLGGYANGYNRNNT